jgi:hypothetical protein
MATHARILVAALCAATALAVCVGTATARRLATSENHFLTHLREITFEGGGTSVVCALSLEGSFHARTIEKIVGSLIGYISEARFKRPCTGGEAWMQTTQEGREESLPWHILYERFIGALPNITGIETTVDNGLWAIAAGGVTCVYRSSTASPLRGIINREAGAKVTGDRASETSPIPKVEGSLFCPNSATLKGTGIVGTQVGYRELTITLVA